MRIGHLKSHMEKKKKKRMERRLRRNRTIFEESEESSDSEKSIELPDEDESELTLKDDYISFAVFAFFKEDNKEAYKQVRPNLKKLDDEGKPIVRKFNFAIPENIEVRKEESEDSNVSHQSFD